MGGNNPEAIILGAAVFVVLGGGAMLKLVLGLYLDERKASQASFLQTVNTQIISIKDSFGSMGKRMDTFDGDLRACQKEISSLKPRLDSVDSASRAILSFFQNGGTRESEIVPIGENAWLVRKKNGKPPGEG